MARRVSRRARSAVKTKRQSDAKLFLSDNTDLIALRNKLRTARLAYYNTGKTVMSDAEYDQLEDKLRQLSPNDKLLRQIGAPVGRSNRKVSLPYPMPSLSKVAPDDTLTKWLATHPGPYTVTDKLDGVSGMIDSKKGEAKFYTRGNGATGTDITHLLPFIRPAFRGLPQGIKAIRGEIGLLRSTFTKKYAKKYENARNLTSGIVNTTKGINPIAKELVYFVHSVVMPNKPISSVASQLRNAGFLVVPSKRFTKLDIKTLMDYLIERRRDSKLDIDGLVITATDGDSVAFKSGESGVVEVDKIIWSTSRYGYLKPTIILKKSIKLAGANINRLTAHNAAHLVEHKIGPGAVIEITRAGDTIPKFLRTLKPSTRNPLPAGFGTKYVWNASGVDLIAVGDTNLREQQISELTTFLIRLDVDKVKEKLVARLVDDGIDTIPKLIDASVNALENTGIGHAAATHLHSRMHEQLKRAKLPALMAGSNMFGRGFGERKFEAILAEVPFKQQLQLYRQSKRKLLERLMVIPGIGLTTAPVYMEGFPKFVRFLQRINWKPTKRIAKTVKKSALGINPIVVFTGFRDKQLVEEIEAVGGKYAPSITKNTTHVVTLTKNSGGKVKLDKAARVGAKVIDLNTFKRLLAKTS